jgi:hypothetical protein
VNALDELDLSGDLVAEEVEVHRTPLAMIVAIVVAAGLVVGLIIVGVTAAFVSVSHTEQGLCGGFGVPCTSLSLDRVQSFSELKLPAGSQVTGAYYNHTSSSTEFWASVRLPVKAKVALEDYQSFGISTIPAETAWAKGKHSLVYLGRIRGDILHSVVSGVDVSGTRELFLSFTVRS